MNDAAIEIIPTCVPKNRAALAEGARAIRAYSSEIHIDIDDGLFAPALTWPYTKKGEFGEFDLSDAAELATEVHLMVQEPRQIGMQFARAGAFRIIGHVEAFPSEEAAHGTLDAWRRNGAREVGLAILMDTPFEMLEHHVFIMDVVHMMSIATIGTQGIPFDPRSIERIAEFHDRYPEMFISIDGGVSESNIADLVRAGARRFGVGSAIMKDANPAAAYARIKVAAESAL